VERLLGNEIKDYVKLLILYTSLLNEIEEFYTAEDLIQRTLYCISLYKEMFEKSPLIMLDLW